MHTLAQPEIALEEIESDADFILFSDEHGLISEHYTAGEARMAYFQEAAKFSLGEHLPHVYTRHDTHWAPLS